ncbi:hypothetical protein BDV96DRAFT_644022 [Lophiotrema nucula]|uniref:Uncharacterized protein n=1 Tax=Lophiotrema nucula TaxID=690887 RepID=A0A6A5ZH21_9PLEO|nr:hypothetical protein BDV96DRAFT_644022 [Lophiotrema nucula]
MTQLLDLPIELIEGVFSYFQNRSDTGTNDLLQLCRTCRVLRTIAQPLLYVDVRLINKGFINHDEANTSLELIARQFSRTLESRLDLAGKVRSLSLPAVGGVKVDDLINTLHNLQVLYLGLLELTPKYPPKFLTLSNRVSVNKLYVESASHVNLANFGPLLVQPSLERGTFHSTVASYGNAFGKPLSLSHGSVLLSELILEDCFMRERCLCEFLKACKSLKSFRFRAANCLNLRFQGYHVGETFLVTPVQILEALEIHRTTLESLSLNFDTCGAGFDDENFRYPGFSSFRRLSKLCIESHRLERFEHLSPALETVRLTHAVRARMLHLFKQDPADIQQRFCPNIQSVILTVYDMETHSASYAQFIGGGYEKASSEDFHEIRSSKLKFDFVITDRSASELDEYHYGAFSKLEDE